MLVRAPLVEAEQDSSIRIEDLTKVSMARWCLGLAEERLVPFEASRHIGYADDRPRAFHDISPVGLTTKLTCRAACNDIRPRETSMTAPVRCSVWFGTAITCK